MVRRVRSFLCPSTSVVLALLLTLTVATAAQAYTVSGTTWSSPGTNYVPDNSYLNQGSGWGNTLDNNTVPSWNSGGPFNFAYNINSANHVQASSYPSGCGNSCLAMTYQAVTNPYSQATVVVNLGPNFGFYDGTQGNTVPPNYYDLASVLRHEFGHIMGLCHSSGSGLLMNGIGAGTVYPVDADAADGDAYLYGSFYGGPPPEGPCLN